MSEPTFVNHSKIINVAMIGPFPLHWGSMRPVGGVATHISSLVPELPKNNIRLSLLGDNTDRRYSKTPEFLSKNISFNYMTRPNFHNFKNDLVYIGPRRIFKIAWKLLSTSKFRNLIPITRQFKIIGQAANYETFLSHQDYKILHIHHAEYRALLCNQILEVKHPLIATVHGVTKILNSKQEWLIPFIKANYQSLDWLIAVSNFVKDVLIEYGADRQRISVIPNGVDTDLFFPLDIEIARIQLRLPIDRYIIMFAGSFHAYKGIDKLLFAVKICSLQHDSIMTIIVGSGPERENLIRLSEELGISHNVLFIDRQSHIDMAVWYQACNLFVLPSQNEGFGLAALEAMSCGKPVVVTSSHGLKHDFVQHFETGILIEYGDVIQLSNTINNIFLSPEISDRLGTNARRRVEQKYKWELIARSTSEVYRRVLTSSRW